MPVLATCESGGEAWGYLVPILAVAIWGGAVYSILTRAASEDLPWLLGLLVACMVIGIAFLLGDEGFHGDGDYLGRFFVSLGVSTTLGLAVGLARKRATLRSVAAAIAGDVFLPGLAILFLIWVFVGTGVCFS
jgi:hypothetical protein